MTVTRSPSKLQCQMITDEQRERLHILKGAFLEENAKLNLSALRTDEACWMGNVLDSLAGLEVPELAELEEGSYIADAGTGGGFPFLPLALTMPKQRFVGMDATQKKLDAIDRIIAKMDIDNAVTVNGRLEELAQREDLREQFDVVTARALAPLNVLIEYLAGLIKVKGHILAWKSLNIDDEMHDALTVRSKLSCHLVRTHEYDLGEGWGKRQILVFQKIAPTPKVFPRVVGVPKKSPIV